MIQGLEQYTSIAASADGRRLVASVAKPRAELLTVPIMARLTTVDDVRPYGVPGVRALAPRLRGQALFYLSGQGTGDGLWRLQDDQATEIWRGSRGALLEAASVSPDGLQVAVVLRQGGKRTLTLERVDGSQPRAIGESIDVAGTSDWSPDGQWVVVGGDDGKGQGLFKISVDGGEPVRLTTGPAFDPVWSPAEDLIVYAGANVGGQAPLLAVRPDGTPVELPPVQTVASSISGRLRFLPRWQWCRVREGGGGGRRSGVLAAGSGRQDDAAAGRADLDHESGRDSNTSTSLPTASTSSSIGRATTRISC